MIIINLIQFALLGIWVFTFVFILTLLLPSNTSLWLTVYLWSPVNSFIIFSPIKAIGKENLDPNKNYVFMANHSSYYDIPCLFFASKRKLHFLAKEELKRNFIFGFMLRKLQMIFVDRSNAQRSIASMRQAIQFISNGMDVAIFPEGTRTKTGNLNVFKRGGFKLAIGSQTDIVPVTIKNSAKAWSRNNIRFRPTTVTVHFGKPISVQGLQESDAQKVSEMVYRAINEELAK